MRIPMPCAFGSFTDCNGESLQFNGVGWYQWQKGMEYTYFFHRNDPWHDTTFYASFQSEQPCHFEIPDRFLVDSLIKDFGYPLKGRGHACGVHYIKGNTYIDFIITSNYSCHIKVQCDDKGMFVPNGDIIFPISWDTPEKRQIAVLEAYRSKY